MLGFLEVGCSSLRGFRVRLGCPRESFKPHKKILDSKILDFLRRLTEKVKAVIEIYFLVNHL